MKTAEIAKNTEDSEGRTATGKWNPNVLHVNTASGWRGGEAQTLELAKGLAADGYCIAVVCQPGSELGKRARENGLEMVEIRMRGEWDMLAVWHLWRAAENFRADILHLHTAHAHMLGMLAALLSGKQKVVVSRRVDFPVGRNLLSRLKYGRWVDQIIAVSEGVRRVLSEGGVDGSKVVTVHSGIDTDKYRCLGPSDYLYEELGVERGDLLVGNVGALTSDKDQSCLLEAARIVVDKIPRAKFLIVGEGGLRDDLVRHARGLRLEGNVIFTGFRRDVGNILSILDVFVLSSRLEGLCTSLLDAMLFSLPIVATETGGIPEVVVDGWNGFLVPVKDPVALADRICRLLLDSELRRVFGKKGREMVRGFDIRQTVRGTERVYEELMYR